MTYLEIKSLEDIKDPEGFLKEYHKARNDLTELRAENKRLTTELESKSDDEAGKWKDRALKAEAKTTLEAQGIKNAERILKYLDLEGVDFDDEGNLTGLDDKVTEVKTDFPELFDTKRRAGRNSADIHDQNPSKRELSPSELQVAAIYGE